jgi:hypothetical protein
MPLHAAAIASVLTPRVRNRLVEGLMTEKKMVGS